MEHKSIDSEDLRNSFKNSSLISSVHSNLLPNVAKVHEREDLTDMVNNFINIVLLD